MEATWAACMVCKKGTMPLELEVPAVLLESSAEAALELELAAAKAAGSAMRSGKIHLILFVALCEYGLGCNLGTRARIMQLVPSACDS